MSDKNDCWLRFMSLRGGWNKKCCCEPWRDMLKTNLSIFGKKTHWINKVAHSFRPMLNRLEAAINKRFFRASALLFWKKIGWKIFIELVSFDWEMILLCIVEPYKAAVLGKKPNQFRLTFRIQHKYSLDHIFQREVAKVESPYWFQTSRRG